MYGRGSAIRGRLDKSYVERLSPLARQRHIVVKDLRDKWVAHAVNHFDEVRIQIAICRDNGVERVQGISTFIQAIGGFRQQWMIELRAMLLEVLDLVKNEIQTESQKLNAMVKAMPLEQIKLRPIVENKAVERPLVPTKKMKRFSKAT